MIFISYAHNDDAPLLPDQDGWVTRFHAALEIRLRQLLGTKEQIVWRDERLDGNDYLSDEIAGQLPQAKVLVSILTPTYVYGSEWCRKELALFREAAERTGGVRVGNKSRIVKVIKTPVPYEEHPPECQGMLGYEFFKVTSHEDFNEFWPEKQTPFYQDYWSRFQDVACDIAKVIKAMERGDPVTISAPAGSLGHIYLAEPASTLFDERDRIRRNFESEGYGILPATPLPLRRTEGDFEATVREVLDRCTVSVQLISGDYGLVPEGSSGSMDELQNKLIGEWQSRNPDARRLIWLPPDLDEVDPRQEALIEELRNHAASLPGSELLEVPIEDFKTAIADTLAKMAERPREQKTESNGPPRVYLVSDRSDLEAIRPIDDYLYESGAEVITPLFEEGQDQPREFHIENLRLCDAVLVYYDGGDPFWLNAKMNDLRKIDGYGREAPLRSKTVYVTGRKTDHKDRFRTREADVVKHFDAFDPAALAPFMSSVMGSKQG